MVLVANYQIPADTQERFPCQFLPGRRGDVVAAVRVGGRVTFPERSGADCIRPYSWYLTSVLKVHPRVCFVQRHEQLHPNFYPLPKRSRRSCPTVQLVDEVVWLADGTKATEGWHYFKAHEPFSDGRQGKRTGLIFPFGIPAFFVVKKQYGQWPTRRESHSIVAVNIGPDGREAQGQVQEISWCGPFWDAGSMPNRPQIVPVAVYLSIVSSAVPPKVRRRWASFRELTYCSLGDDRRTHMIKGDIVSPTGESARQGHRYGYCLWRQFDPYTAGRKKGRGSERSPSRLRGVYAGKEIWFLTVTEYDKPRIVGVNADGEKGKIVSFPFDPTAEAPQDIPIGAYRALVASWQSDAEGVTSRRERLTH